MIAREITMSTIHTGRGPRGCIRAFAHSVPVAPDCAELEIVAVFFLLPWFFISSVACIVNPTKAFDYLLFLGAVFVIFISGGVWHERKRVMRSVENKTRGD
jgi:hypothetical protein